MYKISKYSNKIQFGEIVFEQDSTNENYPAYLDWLQNDGTPEMVDYFDGEMQEMFIKKQINEENINYEKRRRDGIKAYNQINAEFRVLKLNGVIEQGYYDSISELLEGVIFQIITGQWISALQKLEALGSDGIGTQLYDRLHLQISNYVNENY